MQQRLLEVREVLAHAPRGAGAIAPRNGFHDLAMLIGAAVGVTLIALKKSEWSSRLPYGPYIALAATIWIFGGQRIALWWLAP